MNNLKILNGQFLEKEKRLWDEKKHLMEKEKHLMEKEKLLWDEKALLMKNGEGIYTCNL